MTSDRVNQVNTGLMLLSLVAAVTLPFEVFLASYAILGPLHYLTQISWLHDRSYFVPSRWLALPIALLTGTALVASRFLPPALTLPAFASWNAEAAFAALSLSLVFIVFGSARGRLVGSAAVVAAVGIAHVVNAGARGGGAGPATVYDVFFTVFLTTIVHVFVFTGAFVLHGALKARSRSGLVSAGVFLACGAACFALPVDSIPALGETTRTAYGETSEIVSAYVLYYASGREPMPSVANAVYASPGGVLVARFIAYAYTYHYLNWFSKTSIIKWHEVPRRRLVAVGAVWTASVVLYGIDYGLGLRWLFLLSVLHVYLEFPLNWRCFIGIGEELRRRPRAA